MEEIKIIFLSMSAHHLRRQLVVLLAERRNVLFPDGIGLFRSRHHRLHGDLLEAQIRQMQHVLGKIQVVAGKGSAHVVIVLIPAFSQLLELRHNQIVAAVSVSEGTHFVIDLFTSVDT